MSRLFNIVIAAAACIIGPVTAWAGWFSESPMPANAKPLSAVVKGLEEAGYKSIHEIEFEDGTWEVEATGADGKEIKLVVDAVSGEIVKRK